MPQSAARTSDTKLRDAEATKLKLLTAALAAFTTQGYDASSTRNIETAAGVKRGLINYHYGSKEALWKATVDRMMLIAERELSAARENVVHADAKSRLRFFVRAYVSFCARYPELNRLMIQEGMDTDWRLKWLLDRSIRGWYREVCDIFNAAAALGVAPSMDAHHFYYIVTGAATLMFSNAEESQALSGKDPLSPESVEAHAAALADLFVTPGESN